MSGAGAPSVQWLTVCTLQGTHQIQVVLPGAGGAPVSSEVPGWACPDCVPTPPVGALFASTTTFVPLSSPGSVGCPLAASLHPIAAPGPALPPRAPPPAADLSS